MNVKLVSITESVIEDKKLTPEELLVYIARVSNPSNQLNTETSDKLINYLIKNKHWSPLEMVDVTVEIVTSRAIAQQIIRHRSFSFQEFSQRYAQVTDFEEVKLRKQAEKNRQSSTDEFDPEIELLDKGTNQYFKVQAGSVIANYLEQGEDIYKALLEAGVAKESARAILPLTTQTKLYMKGSLRSWITYLNIRLEEHTQLEHRLIAIEIANILQKEFPTIYKSLNSFNNNEGGFLK